MFQTFVATRKANKMLGSRKSSNTRQPNARRLGKRRSLAIFSVLLTSITLILAFLCLYAGHTPGMMEDYAIFTLNTSRIGQNILQELDSKILSVKLKRAEPVLLYTPTITAAPTTLITMAPRANIGSDFSSLTSGAASGIHSAESAAGSKASSVDSAVHSVATSALTAAETNVVTLVNKAYTGIINDLKLKDFYSMHILATCSGEYVFPNGTNVTVGTSGAPANNTHKHVNSCSAHSAVDPVVLIAILYYIGITFTIFALLMSIFGVFKLGTKVALANVLASLFAFLLIGIASAVTHGLTLGAAKLINFIGNDVGIAGYEGGKFLRLTWATTIMLLVNTVLWLMMCFVKDSSAQRTRPDRTNVVLEEYPRVQTRQAEEPKGSFLSRCRR